MYKLLLVEDEEIIRKGLMAKIKYYKFNISEYYEAYDGLEALKIAEKVKPDIVVTDIRLLTMDGLSLIEQISKNNKNTKFIIVSGYPNFEYAKKAIEFGVVSYLLKPVGLEELKEALLNCIEQIENQRCTDLERKMLESENNKLEQIHNVLNLLYSDPNDSNILYKEKTEKLFPNDTSFVLASIMLSEESFAQSKFGKGDMELIRYAITNITDDIEYKDDKIVFYNLQSKNELYLLFAAHDHLSIMVGTEDYINKIIYIVHKYLNVYFNVFVSDVHGCIHPVMLEEIRSAVNSKPINLKIGSILRYRSGFKNPTIQQEDLKYLKSCIVNHYTTQIWDALKRFFEYNKKYTEKSTVLYYSLLFSEIVSMLESIKKELKIDKPIEKELKTASEIIAEKFTTEKEAQEFLYKSILSIFDAENMNFENIRTVNRIKLAQQYIESHYDEPIGANELAEQFELNPNYFCTLFKKEVGQTVINYLTHIRIQKACHLLKTTTNSANEISKMIGYENVNYFYKTFKKQTGVTPVEYRNANTK